MGIGGYFAMNPKKVDKPVTKPVTNQEPSITKDDNFTTSIIKMANANKNSNYLISPYSMEIALNMLRDGANGNTKEEIDKLIGNREIPNLAVKDKLNIANALFVKNKYQGAVLESYANKIKNDYDGEILYDEFTSPKIINDWVNTKTNQMIPVLMKNISPNFAFGIVNAIALDIKWKDEFECDATNKKEFTKIDGSKINVEMMHNSYEYEDYKYLQEDSLEGVILPYEKIDDSNVELEFVALMPNDINSYINNLSMEKLSEIDSKSKKASSKVHLLLSLPRFTYDYDFTEFKESLISLGIKDVFDEELADLSNVIPKDRMSNNIYVGEAIHKTKIELSETGTKAAAVTAFITLDNAMPIREEYETVKIDFNKPFIYMIREKNSKEIIFFGVTYEPNLWNGTTCK